MKEVQEEICKVFAAWHAPSKNLDVPNAVCPFSDTKQQANSK